MSLLSKIFGSTPTQEALEAEYKPLVDAVDADDEQGPGYEEKYDAMTRVERKISRAGYWPTGHGSTIKKK